MVQYSVHVMIVQLGAYVGAPIGMFHGTIPGAIAGDANEGEYVGSIVSGLICVTIESILVQMKVLLWVQLTNTTYVGEYVAFTVGSYVSRGVGFFVGG